MQTIINIPKIRERGKREAYLDRGGRTGGKESGAEEGRPSRSEEGLDRLLKAEERRQR